MRKILVALSAGLFVITLTACGGDSPSKAKTAKSDSDSSDSDSDSDSSSKKSSSSKSSKSSGGNADDYCAQIQEISKTFNELDSDVPSDREIDAIIAALRDLQDAAPDEIQDEMTAFVEIEIAAASAAKAAANNSEAQESAANSVLSDAGDEFLNAVTKVDQFTTDTCGFDLSGETASDFSDFSDFSDSFSDFSFSS